MNDDNHNIDRLLQANVEKQLSQLDWERFDGEVTKHLATGRLRPRRHTRRLRPLAIAAGIVLTAGVLVAIVVETRESADHRDASVTVSLTESPPGAGSATVALLDAAPAQAAKSSAASLCIVVRRDEPLRGPGRRSSRTSIACLF